MSNEYSTSGGYHYELLKVDNWMPWKRHMLAVFRDFGLEKFIAIHEGHEGSRISRFLQTNPGGNRSEEEMG